MSHEEKKGGGVTLVESQKQILRCQLVKSEMIARTFEQLLTKRLTRTSERVSLIKHNAPVVAKIYPRKLKPL